MLTIQDRITRLADMSDRCKQETANGLLVPIMETVSDNLGQIEICTPEDANAMIDLAQKMVELRGTIELDPHADQTRDFDADFPNLGAFRANVVEGGNIPGRS